MRTRIVGATIRDLSYVAANMRPEDRAEVEAQFDDWSPAGLAALSLRDHAYCVEMDGNPEAAFGAGRVGHRNLWLAWSWMTPRGWRCVPRISDFVRRVMIPDIYASGGQRVEARALEANQSARRWLKRLGAVERCALPCYGRSGETFVLYDWTRDDHEHVSAAAENPDCATALAGRA